jgi:Uma2 family endonuclease
MTAPPISGSTSRTFRKVIDALPESMRGEVIAGRLTVMPRPAPAHAEVIAAVSTALRRRFHDGGDGATWWILPEVELSLGVDPDFDPVVPDLSGWRRAVVPRFPPGASVSVVPQWVCEVLSPRTARSDRDDKLPFYARAGVDHAWIIDPDDRTLEAFARDGDIWRAAGAWGARDVARVAPFEELALDLATLWLE